MTHRTYRRRLAAFTLTAILLITGLAFAPFWVRTVVIVAGFLLFLAGLWRAFNQPITDVDRHCAAVDEELTRREWQERAARDAIRTQRNVVALPQKASADVLQFPTRGGGWRG